jgi:beta-N-acetylhexosaminidase
MIRLPPGRVMTDLEGIELTASDRKRLQHPGCAGVILFTRNYRDQEQLSTLCAEIKSLRDPALLIAVDHEGGRVQRFRHGFTAIPAMRRIGELWDQDHDKATMIAHDAGHIIGVELGACGIDFSFAPVLDLDYARSTVIGDRAFHSSSEVVIRLARSFIAGLNASGMIAVGKHFPGHGAVVADTHLDIAVDHRELADIEANDLLPFIELCRQDLGGVMPAHVIYDKIDSNPAGFSRYWLQDILRTRLGFQGIVFSDDLSMRGAGVAGDAPARAGAALAAGCDLALVCNAPDDADAVLHTIRQTDASIDTVRLESLYRRTRAALPQDTNEETGIIAARERITGAQLGRIAPIA